MHKVVRYQDEVKAEVIASVFSVYCSKCLKLGVKSGVSIIFFLVLTITSKWISSLNEKLRLDLP